MFGLHILFCYLSWVPVWSKLWYRVWLISLCVAARLYRQVPPRHTANHWAGCQRYRGQRPFWRSCSTVRLSQGIPSLSMQSGLGGSWTSVEICSFEGPISSLRKMKIRNLMPFSSVFLQNHDRAVEVLNRLLSQVCFCPLAFAYGPCSWFHSLPFLFFPVFLRSLPPHPSYLLQKTSLPFPCFHPLFHVFFSYF